MKKKRTTKGKPVVIAQEAVPFQTVEATTNAPVEQLSVPKRKSQKRKRKLILEDAIEVNAPVPASVEQPAVVLVVEGTTEDPDTVINLISGDKDDKQSDRAETWFDRAFDEMLRNDSPVVTPSDTDEA
ncbi:bifunctional purine biosynthesis protein purH-like [Dorcoceras hygrometricum]|uniref:Bifunctional purine biosynthesis protein purH-like n=1 Tax=Dorcoceras hygrometricum TaxID=472368 RepID=A0A2Z7A062_9LAMI|nr:bifunctional purine biosynthesis protein purH-like [Dorcoceras hygrometricum]